MPKIKSPNPEYNGVSASLTFVKGEAETDDKWLQEWFSNKGYEVIDTNDSNNNDNENNVDPDADGQKQKELTNDQLREELDKLGAEYKASDNKDELKEKLSAAQEKAKAE
jgi:hypothetical protein